MRKGYKITEVGVIPQDWEVKAIGEITNVDSESLTAKTRAEYEFKYISLEDVDRGTLKGYSEQVFSTSPSRAKRVLRYGDVLFSTVRPNLKSHLLFNRDGDDWVCSTGFSVLRCQNSLSIAEFLFFHLFSENINSQIETLIAGSNYPAINSSDVRKLKIPVPSAKEQKAIAQTLSDVDALIAALDKFIAKNRHLKTATMQQLLTGKKRLPEFGEGMGYKLTDVGMIPEDWEVARLETVCKVNQGLQIAIEKRLKRPTSKAQKYITIQSLNSSNDWEYIENYSSSVSCNKDDILMTRTGNTGIVVTGVNGVFHNNFFKVTFNKNRLSKNYFVYYLRANSTQKIIMEKAGTSTIPDLNHNDFYSIQAALPKLQEQKAIATILSDIDEEIQSLEKRREKTQLIKQGMMQELLTGKTRLINS